MFGDKDKMAAAILGKLSGKRPAPAEESDEDGLAACMEDLIHAFHAKDAAGAAEAFRRCVELGGMPELEPKPAAPESMPAEEA